jgi:hypothetical protein
MTNYILCQLVQIVQLRTAPEIQLDENEKSLFFFSAIDNEFDHLKDEIISMKYVNK